MGYAGGIKGLIFQKLINLIPPHEVYIESHLGLGTIMRKKRPAMRNIGIEIDAKVIKKWREENPLELELVHGAAISYLSSYVYSGKELVYCDPPYFLEKRKSHRKYYRYEYSVEQHAELLEVIKSLPCRVMISGYESRLYKESLKDWYTKKFQTATRHGEATEWVWMNYSPPLELHDYRYLGDNFRERERIKKRAENWLSRLRSMPVLERQSLLSAMRSVVNEG